jgi:hypothetical protein
MVEGVRLTGRIMAPLGQIATRHWRADIARTPGTRAMSDNKKSRSAGVRSQPIGTSRCQATWGVTQLHAGLSSVWGM